MSFPLLFPLPIVRPKTLLARIGLEDLLDKWPQQCVPMGEIVGDLSALERSICHCQREYQLCKVGQMHM